MESKHSLLIVAYQSNTLKRLVKQLQEIGFHNYLTFYCKLFFALIILI